MHSDTNTIRATEILKQTDPGNHEGAIVIKAPAVAVHEQKTISALSVWILICGLSLGFILGTFLPGYLPGIRKNSATGAFQIRYSNENANENFGTTANETPAAEIYDVEAELQKVPLGSEEQYLKWMLQNTNEEEEYILARWQLSRDFVASGELKGDSNIAAVLRTPREKFVREANINRAYHDTWLPIGYGATITDPDVVAMMTTSLDVKPEHRVLEIGTGSGYQSAILSNLSNHVYTIEIIEPLFFETARLQKELANDYASYRHIVKKLGDGFYGWEKYAPFDRIIVTCSIDHLPPPLIRQLADDGIMIIPLGPPGKQFIMEVKKSTDENGNIVLKRRDVYNGLSVKFIPFRNESGQGYSE